jgi:hypothetical protein
MLTFVEARAAARGLAGPSEYLQELIAAAQRDQEQADLEARFTAAMRAIERGEANPLSPEDWRLLRERALDRQAAR